MNRKHQRKRSRRARLALECLEARQLLAGDFLQIPGNSSSIRLNQLVSLGDAVYFNDNDELHRIRDDHQGTIVVDDQSTEIHDLHTIGNKLIYRHNDDDILTYEPSTGAVTNLSEDLGNLQFLRDLVGNGTVSFFTARDIDTGTYWTWSTNGTKSGTRRIVEHTEGLPPGVNDFHPYADGVIFEHDDGQHGLEPWVSDGTTGGTHLLADLRSGSRDSGPQLFAGFDKVFFAARSSATNTSSSGELYVVDSSGDDATLLSNINSGTTAIDDESIVVAGGYAYFPATDGQIGEEELWRSDGTPGGTELVTDLVPGSGGSNPRNLVAAEGHVYFNTDFGIHVTNVATKTTTLLESLTQGQSNNVTDGVAIGDKAYYGIDKSPYGAEIWEFSPTGARVFDLEPGSDGLNPGKLTAIDDLVYFTGRPSSRTNLYVLGTSDASFSVPHSSVTLSEAGATNQTRLTVTRSGGLPFENLQISISNSNPAAVSVPSSVTIPAGQTAATVLVRAINDAIDDATQSATLTFSGVGLGSHAVTVSVTDDDTHGVRLDSVLGLQTSESAGSDSFTVRLLSEPVSNVTINFASSAPDEVPPPNPLTFSASNWNLAQTVRLVGADDDVDDGNRQARIDLAISSSDALYAAFNPPSIVATNIDDDTAGFDAQVVGLPQASESGDSATWDFKLTSEPTADVTFQFTSSDETEILPPQSLTFTAANWNQTQTATITSVNDDIDDGNMAVLLSTQISSQDAIYSALLGPTLSLINRDDDQAGIQITPTSNLQTSEAAANEQVSIVLDSQPTADVTVRLVSLDETEVVASSAVTFTTDDWQSQRFVTFFGQDDDVVDGNQTVAVRVDIESADAIYANLSVDDLSVMNGDDDQPMDPAITWSDPDGITFGVPLSAVQLAASSDVAGSFVYSPAAGTVLDAGAEQVLSVTFTPDDAVNFNVVTASVKIDVAQATPSILWNDPAAITFGDALTATQLNASADVAGSLVYDPPLGTLLDAGSGQTLQVTFESDDANYTNAQRTVSIDVLKADPVVTWNEPDAIYDGTPLSSQQLSASTDVAGAFVYDPAIDTVLGVGNDQVLSATFTPDDAANYNTIERTVLIDVLALGVPAINWPQPDAITFGTVLSATQLAATSDQAGTFAYNPPAETQLDAGEHTLSVTFTPDDQVAFTNATETVTITVDKATPVVTWNEPDAIYDGTPLSNQQLGATADVAGAFVYDPAIDTVLGVGNDHVLSATFTPDDAANYNTIERTVLIDVLAIGVPAINWPQPDAIMFGTVLSATQLAATSNQSGTFAYDPPAETQLDAGEHTLSVTFTPDDQVAFTNATETVTITVDKATPVITWLEPDAITVGEALGGAQLDATADVDGTFVYTPAAGTVLPVGDDQQLSLTFTPDSTNYRVLEATTSIDVLADIQRDFGDAADSFKTLAASDGPSHVISDLFLGASIDAEADGQPSNDANADTDDGVRQIATLIRSATSATTSSFHIIASADGLLDAWLDFDGNGSLDHPSEHIGSGVSVPLVPGDNIVSVTLPAGTSSETIAARFRISSAGELLPTGEAADGEVEDYVFDIASADASSPVPLVVEGIVGNVIRVSSDGSSIVIRDDQQELFRSELAPLERIELKGSAGDDVFEIEDLDFAGDIPIAIDAAAGDDVLRLLAAGQTLDWTSASSIRGIERIDISGSGDNRIVLNSDSFDDSLALTMDSRDRLEIEDGDFAVTGSALDNGELALLLTSDTSTLSVYGTGWTNPLQRLDVNNSGTIEAIDALQILNEITRRNYTVDGSTMLQSTSTLAEFPLRFYDTNGDGNLTPIDALRIINALSRAITSGEQPLGPPIDNDDEEQAVSGETHIIFLT